MKKRLATILLTVVLIITVIPVQSTFAAQSHRVNNASTLSNALSSIGNGDTIILDASINTTDAVTIPSGKSITIDLNGYNLNIDASGSTYGSALYIDGQSKLSVIGTGTLNAYGRENADGIDSNGDLVKSPSATVNATGYYGVWAYKGTATVSSASSSEYAAVYSYFGSNITVTGNVTASGDATCGVYACDNSVATVGGKIDASSADEALGIEAIGSSVTVKGNVSSNGAGAISASPSSKVLVEGDVKASDPDDCSVVYADYNSSIDIKGNVSASGEDDFNGVYANSSTIKIGKNLLYSGTYSDCNGINSDTNSMVEVKGNATLTGGEDFYGITQKKKGNVTIGGNISVKAGSDSVGVNNDGGSASITKINGTLTVSSGVEFINFDGSQIAENKYSKKVILEGLRYFDYIHKSCLDSHVYIKDPSYPADLSSASVSKIKDQVYNNKSIQPSVTVVLRGKTLKMGTDFSASYKNNKNPGKASVVIKGINAYKGTITKDFKIIPKKQATVKSAKSAGKNQLKVTWKKDPKVDGYQLAISTDNKFKNNKKSAVIKKNSSVKKIFKNTKKGKAYYVKIRAYKVIDGKKAYGAWSTVKKSVK